MRQSFHPVRCLRQASFLLCLGVVANNKLPKDFKQKALDYHKADDHWDSKPGKLEIRATKALVTQRDLSYAYSPGVAEPCLAIKDDENAVPLLTTATKFPFAV